VLAISTGITGAGAARVGADAIAAFGAGAAIDDAHTFDIIFAFIGAFDTDAGLAFIGYAVAQFSTGGHLALGIAAASLWATRGEFLTFIADTAVFLAAVWGIAIGVYSANRGAR
jgi:hypothetical protein